MKAPRGGAGRQRGKGAKRRLSVALDAKTSTAIGREAKRLGLTESRVAAERLQRSFAEER